MVGKTTDDVIMSASRLSAILNCSPYSTPNEELKKSIEALQGIGRNVESSIPMDVGNLLENYILNSAFKKLAMDTFSCEIDKPYKHHLLPLACSLDGYAQATGQIIKTNAEEDIYVMNESGEIKLDGFGPVEAKTTNDAFNPEELPLHRGVIQLQGQMMCSSQQGAKWGAVAVLHQNRKLAVYIFEPHYDTQTKIAEAVVKFQEKIDYYKETGELLEYPSSNSADANHTYPEAKALENPLHLETDADKHCELIATAKTQIKFFQDQIDKAEAQLKDMMQDYGVATTMNYDIKWGMRNYKAQPEKIVPAKDAYSVRQKTLTIKEKKL